MATNKNLSNHYLTLYHHNSNIKVMKQLAADLKNLNSSGDLKSDVVAIVSLLKPLLKGYKTRELSKQPIVLVGGGSGTPVVGRALQNVGINSFAMVANVADTLRNKETMELVGPGLMKELFNMPDVVDITKQLLHACLLDKRSIFHNLLDQKIDHDTRIGYLMLAALLQSGLSLQESINFLSDTLGNSYEVAAVSEEVTEIYFAGVSQKFLNLYQFAKVDPGPPVNMKLEPPAEILPSTARLLGQARYIIFGPGDVHFSVLPHFLVNGFTDAVRSSQAKLIVVINLTARLLDTPGFTVSKFLDLYDKYLPTGQQCVAVINKYSSQSKLSSLLIDDVNASTYGRFELVRADLADDIKNNNNQLVHDQLKLGQTLKKIFNNP